ncbi:MAG: DUF1772 domain-containing protein [Gemmatimonadales bacterium]
MVFEVVAILCAGLFAGAAIYITAVEHPARLACGTALAVREFAPSYRRAAIMQAALAVLGFLAAIGAYWQANHGGLLLGGLLLGAVVPFTLVGIAPITRRLLAPHLLPDSAEAGALLRKWGQLHAVRSILGDLAFTVLLICSVRT